MNNLIEDLKKYFETTPREKVLENWAKSESFDKIGPTMDDFLDFTNKYFKVKSEDPIEGCKLNKNDLSLKFPSGFFFQ